MRMGRRCGGRGWGVIGSGLRERRRCVQASQVCQGRWAVSSRCIDVHVWSMRQSPAARYAGLVRTALFCAFPSGRGSIECLDFLDGGFAGRHMSVG